MLKVLIADDEMLVRIGLKTAIPWGEEYGFELVGEAINGRDAWEKIQQTEPDILITDIQMPKMDGLELLRLIQESGRDIRTIILTCHSDFEYAREAIRFGVKDYVLKLTTMPDELLSILLDIKKDLLKKDQAHKDTASISKAERKAVFLNRLTSGVLSTQEALRSEAETMGLLLKPDNIFALRIEPEPSFVTTSEAETSMSTHTLCVNLLNEWLYKNKRGELFCPDEDGFLLLLNSEPNELDTIIISLRQLLLQYLNLSVSIGVSGPCDASNIQQACHECVLAMEQRFFYGTGSTVFYSDVPIPTDSCNAYSYRAENSILEGLSRLDSLQVEQTLFPLVAEICKSTLNRRLCMERLDEILGTFSRAAKLYGGSRHQFSKEWGADWYADLHTLTFAEDVIPWFGRLIPSFCEYLRRCKNQQCRSEIALIQDYIHEHYGEKITLEFAASYVFMSPAHFSKLFKKSTGKNFVDYLAEYRIEKAKQLLVGSALMIYQISEQVGYSNFNYFSKVFKRYTGMTPKDYRETG